MAKAQLFVGKVTDGLDFIVSQNEETIRTQQVITQQESIMRGDKHLVWALEQTF